MYMQGYLVPIKGTLFQFLRGMGCTDLAINELVLLSDEFQFLRGVGCTAINYYFLEQEVDAFQFLRGMGCI